MRLALRKSTSRSATKMHVRVGGVTRDVERAWIRVGGVTRQFFASIDSGGATAGISANPSEVFGAAISSSPVVVTSRSTLVSVNGGVAPYSYAWTQVSGDTMAATDPASNDTAFSATVAPSAVLNATWRCDVTDAAGSTSSVEVTVSLFNRGGTM